MPTQRTKPTTQANGHASPLDRLPPSDRAAETAVLGSILLRPEVLDEVSLELRPTDFHDWAHETIYAAMLVLGDGGRPIDHNLLIDRLKRDGVFDQIGAATIAELARSVPTPAHAVHYARIVREAAARRDLIRLGADLVRMGYEGDAEDTRHLLGQAEQRVATTIDYRHSEEAKPASNLMVEALQSLDAAKSGARRGTPTGYADLDQMLGGLRPGELLILAARPSMGKTAWALNLAQNLADDGQAVLLCSLEMSNQDLADRLLSAVSRVSAHRMRGGYLNNTERQRITLAANAIASWPMLVNDAPRQSVSDIAAHARRAKRAGKLDLLIVDYLQLIEPSNPRDSREQQVAMIVRRLKGLARELKIPLLCLAQLNRQVEGRADKRPTLGDLRESGAIEQDADVVMFVHRPEYYAVGEDDKHDLAGQAELLVRKHRNGPTGDAKLTWFSETMRFESAGPARYSEFDEYQRESEPDA